MSLSVHVAADVDVVENDDAVEDDDDVEAVLNALVTEDGADALLESVV